MRWLLLPWTTCHLCVLGKHLRFGSQVWSLTDIVKSRETRPSRLLTYGPDPARLGSGGRALHLPRKRERARTINKRDMVGKRQLAGRGGTRLRECWTPCWSRAWTLEEIWKGRNDSFAVLQGLSCERRVGRGLDEPTSADTCL